jgi:hypothetical protein
MVGGAGIARASAPQKFKPVHYPGGDTFFFSGLWISPDKCVAQKEKCHQALTGGEGPKYIVAESLFPLYFQPFIS